MIVYIVTKGEQAEGGIVLGVYRRFHQAVAFAEKIEGVGVASLVAWRPRLSAAGAVQDPTMARWNINSVDRVEITRSEVR